MAFKILVTEKIGKEGIEYLKAQPDVELDDRAGIKRDELLAIVGGYEAILTRSGTAIDEAVLGAAKRLRVASRAGVGVDNVDINAATRRGILVVNEPRGNTTSAAEHTIALLLSLARNLPAANKSVKAGEWNRSKFMGMELSGKTIGIIGLGKVGSKVAKFARCFDMNVICFDPYILKEKADAVGAALLPSLDTLLQAADVITVHTPLNDETRGMVGSRHFSLMKNGVIVINCARGGIIDEKALYESLKNGKAAGAAIDVWSAEPIEPGSYPHMLLELDNVVGTPHIGANTRDAQANVAIGIAEQTVRALRGEMVSNAVNLPYIIDAADLEKSQGFIRASKLLGSVLSQLGSGRIRKITVEFGGKVPQVARKPAVTFAAQGILERTMPNANAVNTMMLAEESGIIIEHVVSSQQTDYSNRIAVTASYEDGKSNTVSGSLFSGKYLRLTGFNGLAFESKVAPRMLVVFNKDVPGVVGLIGGVLGRNRVNIAEMSLGRDEMGGNAISVILVDQELPGFALEELSADRRVQFAREISLDESLIYAPNGHSRGVSKESA